MVDALVLGECLQQAMSPETANHMADGSHLTAQLERYNSIRLKEVRTYLFAVDKLQPISHRPIGLLYRRRLWSRYCERQYDTVFDPLLIRLVGNTLIGVTQPKLLTVRANEY